MKTARPFFVGVVLGAMLHSCHEPDYALATTKAAIAAKGNGTVQNEDHKQRGQQLLAALLAASHSGRWSEPGGRRMDVSEVVLKYIPVGTSFTDAQDIMHYAGVPCGLFLDKPPRPPFLAGGTDLSHDLFSSTNVEIQLFPKIPGDFTSNVGAIHAGLLASEL
jgi:hypothetical protein